MCGNTAGSYRAYGKLRGVSLNLVTLARTVGLEGSFPLSNLSVNSQDTSVFPVRLLIAGYGTACLVALLLTMLGVGILVTGIVFWLGGAVAVLFWGAVWARLRKSPHAPSQRPGKVPAVPRVAVSAR